MDSPTCTTPRGTVRLGRYRLLQAAKARADAATESAGLGTIPLGEELRVVASKLLDGRQRVQYIREPHVDGPRRGWMSLNSSDGTPILERLKAPPPPQCLPPQASIDAASPRSAPPNSAVADAVQTEIRTDIKPVSVLVLHSKIRWCKPEALQLMAQENMDGIDEKTGNAGIHIASQNNNLPAATRLLELGCNVNKQNVQGHTALHMANVASYQEMRTLLLGHGANLEICNKFGVKAGDAPRASRERSRSRKVSFTQPSLALIQEDGDDMEDDEGQQEEGSSWQEDSIDGPEKETARMILLRTRMEAIAAKAKRDEGAGGAAASGKRILKRTVSVIADTVEDTSWMRCTDEDAAFYYYNTGNTWHANQKDLVCTRLLSCILAMEQLQHRAHISRR